jgi:hypothetical protein
MTGQITLPGERVLAPNVDPYCPADDEELAAWCPRCGPVTRAGRHHSMT